VTEALPFALSPAVAPTPGICRVCGCTDGEGCLEEVNHEESYIVVCSWVEDDLCSRCHGPRRPTRLQAGEIARIQSRQGPVRVTRGRGSYQLEVALLGADPGPAFRVRPAVLTLDASGRVVHRLERVVTARDQTAAAAAK
jgi:hypothetical protein